MSGAGAQGYSLGSGFRQQVLQAAHQAAAFVCMGLGGQLVVDLMGSMALVLLTAAL